MTRDIPSSAARFRTPWMDDGDVQLYHGDAADVMEQLDPDSAIVAVTSPPYWRQRIYGGHEIGAEESVAEYAEAIRLALRPLKRVLRPEGTLWLNIGDKYAAGGLGGGGNRGDRKAWETIAGRGGYRMPPLGYKPKDLTLAPFHVAEKLRQDGWYLRQVVVWNKLRASEPMREDRPATAHEYVFQLTLREQYAVGDPGDWWHSSVWSIAPDGDGSHPAMMPVALAKACIRSSSKPGDTVIDPFVGSGTVCLAARALGRSAIGIDLSADYLGVAARRLQQLSLLAPHVDLAVPMGQVTGGILPTCLDPDGHFLDTETPECA